MIKVSRLAPGVLGCLCLCLLPVAVRAAADATNPPAQDVPVLRTVNQALTLPAEELKNGRPLQAALVVTYVSATYNLLFAQDDTSGIYLETKGGLTNIQPGSLLQVKSLARRGLFAPYLQVTDLRVAGEKPLPQPLSVTLDRILTGSLDSQWVELVGVVRSERLSTGQLHLEVAGGASRVKVEVAANEKDQPSTFVDHLVRIRGVVASQADKDRRIQGFRLLVSGFSDIVVLEPPAHGSGSNQPTAIKDLKTYAARRDALHRVRVRGVVTGFWPGVALFLQDPTGAVLVRTAFNGELNPGDVVEALGFLPTVLKPACLEDAAIVKMGTSDPCRPLRITPDVAFKGDHDHTLVEMEAALLHEVQWRSNLVTFALRGGSSPLTAILRAPVGPDLRRLQGGSMVLLTGVCQRDWPAGGGEPELRLWLRSPADVRVQVAAAQPVRARDLYQLMLVSSLLAILLLGALIWVNWRHRRRTERILGTQGELQMELRQNEAQLHRSLQEREEISQNLHDDIIQSIYAVGLGLENVRRNIRQGPEKTEPILAGSIAALNEVIGKVRSYIAGLEPKILSGSEFKTALKSLAVTAGDSRTQFAIDVDSVAAGRLTPPEALQLLNVAKEAISNSLRHAQASRLTVSLRPEGLGLRLEIQDDGVGFDPNKPEPRGLGLRNMASRAATLGGQLEIVSSPGTGCSIVVHVPKRSVDDLH